MLCILAHGPTPFELAALLLGIVLMVACPPALMLPFGTVTRRRQYLGIIAGILLNIAAVLLLAYATGFPAWEQNENVETSEFLLFILIPGLAEFIVPITIILAVEAVICHDRWQRIQSAREHLPTHPTP